MNTVQRIKKTIQAMDRRTLKSRAQRLAFLNSFDTEEITAGPGHFDTALYYYQEARNNYWLGNPVSAIIMADKTIENLLHACLSDYELRNIWPMQFQNIRSVSKLVRWAKENGYISSHQAELILTLHGLAEPYLKRIEVPWTYNSEIEIAEEVMKILVKLFAPMYNNLSKAYTTEAVIR